MKKVELENIKEIRLCWDWEIAIIPKNNIKILKYEGIQDNLIPNSDTSYECDYVYLKLDLKYLKEHYYYEGNDLDYYKENKIEPDSKKTIYEALQDYNVWDIQVIYNNNRLVHLSLPSKPVSDVWSKNKEEYHKENEETLTIRWATKNALEDLNRRRKKKWKLK